MIPLMIYCIAFVMLFFFTIYPTTEIESLGLTVDQLCTSYLANEHGFIQYHIKATSIKLLVHATMPFAFVWFVWIMAWTNPDQFIAPSDPPTIGEGIWNLFSSAAGTILLLAMLTVFYWSRDGWSNHPIAIQLHNYTTPTLPDWRSVATNINDEYRRNTKMTVRSNAISTLVVTESWIIKTNLYVHNIAPQTGTMLIGYKVDTQQVVTETLDSADFVNIAVRPSGGRTAPFTIRINGLLFRDLKDHLQQAIILLPSFKFATLIERFVDVFKQQVALNPTSESTFVPGPDDTCLACLQVRPNLQIVKHCADVDASGAPLADAERCQTCACRPLWCVGCLATWFASQQQRFERDRWLSQKTTCPMCRARFCVRDVCYTENLGTPAEQNEE